MSQTTRSKSEFLGLRDPYADIPAGAVAPKREKQPLVSKDGAQDLLRAAGTMAVICLLIAVAIKVLY